MMGMLVTYIKYLPNLAQKHQYQYLVERMVNLKYYLIVKMGIKMVIGLVGIVEKIKSITTLNFTMIDLNIEKMEYLLYQIIIKLEMNLLTIIFTI